MAFSMEAISKNSFLTFAFEGTDVADESSLMSSSTMRRRSQSHDIARSSPEAEELQELTQLSTQRLTTVLNSGALQPSMKAFAGEAFRARSPARTPQASRTSSPALATPAPVLKGSLGAHKKLWDNEKRVSSNCSLSTMAPDDAADIASPMLSSSPGLGLKRAALSSGSICSMVSWADMSEADGEVQLELEIEAGASAANEEAIVESPPLPSPLPTPCPQVAECPAMPPGIFMPCPQAAGKVSAEMSHGLVPKNQNMEEMYQAAKGALPTTLMIRNIPGKYSQEALMMDLNDCGFSCMYDFLYLPIDKATSNNVGYAFVNFVDPLPAANCMKFFQGHCFVRVHRSSNKLARISVAHLQGLENNMRHYEKTAVNVSKEKTRRPLVITNLTKIF